MHSRASQQQNTWLGLMPRFEAWLRIQIARIGQVTNCDPSNIFPSLILPPSVHSMTQGCGSDWIYTDCSSYYFHTFQSSPKLYARCLSYYGTKFIRIYAPNLSVELIFRSQSKFHQLDNASAGKRGGGTSRCWARSSCSHHLKVFLSRCSEASASLWIGI